MHPEKGIHPWYCNSPRCERESCRNHFYHDRVALISDLVEKYALFRFFSLTLDRSKSKEESWEIISDYWANFRHLVKRGVRRLVTVKDKDIQVVKFAPVREWKYVAILEAHPSDEYPHIHGFTSHWMEQAVWSALWDKATKGSFVVDVRYVKDVSKVGDYVGKDLSVSKYVGKDQMLTARNMGRKKRMLWRSNGLKSDAELCKQRDTDWRIIREAVYDGNGNFDPVKGGMYVKLEATRGSIPSRCLEEGFKDVEAEE